MNQLMHVLALQRELHLQLLWVRQLLLMLLPVTQIRVNVLIFSLQDQELLQPGLVHQMPSVMQAEHRWQAHMWQVLQLFI
jgi:hypothetical protein